MREHMQAGCSNFARELDRYCEEQAEDARVPFWEVFLVRVKRAVGLDDSKEEEDALREYDEVRLWKGAMLEDMIAFVAR